MKKGRKMFRIVWIGIGTLIHFIVIWIMVLLFNFNSSSGGELGDIGLALFIGTYLPIGLVFLGLYWVISIILYIMIKKQNRGITE